MRLPRFLFRVHDEDVEEEARLICRVLGIEDVEIRLDDTVAEAWLEDYEANRTIYGLEKIREYLESLVRS